MRRIIVALTLSLTLAACSPYDTPADATPRAGSDLRSNEAATCDRACWERIVARQHAERAWWAEVVAQQHRARDWRRLLAHLEAQRAEAARRATTGNTVWDRLARCEAGGNWSINTGNGYYGGLQFALRSWRAVGGTGYPHHASRETQIAMGERLRRVQGWGAWPACSRRLGLR